MDAILNEEGTAIVSVGDLRRDLFPHVLFPSTGPDQSWRDANLCYRVRQRLVPGDDYNPDIYKPIAVEPFIYAPGDVRSVQLVALTLEEIKDRKINALAVEFSVRRKSGVTVSGHLFATTNDGHQELKALKERLDRVGGTQKAVTRAGDMIEADATQATAIFTAVDDYIAACWSREYDLRVAVNAATDATELEAIDITSGWPVSEQPQ